jgi:hypothetical protein
MDVAHRTLALLSKIDLARPEILALTQRAVEIREEVRTNPCGPALDLSDDENALALNQAFFARNLFKVELAVAAFHASLSHYHRWIDIGAGAGTASLACAAELPALDHLIIDRSNAQIALAKSLWLTAFPDISPMFMVSDVLRDDLLVLNSGRTIVVASYWLCEQRPEQFRQAIRFIKSNSYSALFIVDYSYVVRRSTLVARRENLMLLDAQVDVPISLQGYIGQDSVTVSAGLYFDV